jgi:protein-disulfide isomerase
MTKEIKIMIGIAVVVIIGGVLLFTTSNSTPAEVGAPVDNSQLIRSNSHMTGKADAKVTIVEFGDYECPACAAAEPVVERLRTEYKDNPEVNFVFRNFPLPQHRKAMVSAEAAEAAGEQGKFWEMSDAIYINQAKWIGSNDHMAVFERLAQELGLNVDQFKQSIAQEKYSEVIRADKQDGDSLGVNSTPTFFINGVKTSSFQYDELKSKIEEQLK